jgi:hypothetical protein
MSATGWINLVSSTLISQVLLPLCPHETPALLSG